MKNWCTLIYATVLLPRLPPDATLRLWGDDTAKPLNPLTASHCQGGSFCSRCAAPLPLLWHWHSSTYCMPILGAKRAKNITPTPTPPLFFYFPGLALSLSICDLAACCRASGVLVLAQRRSGNTWFSSSQLGQELQTPCAHVHGR